MACGGDPPRARRGGRGGRSPGYRDSSPRRGGSRDRCVPFFYFLSLSLDDVYAVDVDPVRLFRLAGAVAETGTDTDGTDCMCVCVWSRSRLASVPNAGVLRVSAGYLSCGRRGLSELLKICAEGCSGPPGDKVGRPWRAGQGHFPAAGGCARGLRRHIVLLVARAAARRLLRRMDPCLVDPCGRGADGRDGMVGAGPSWRRPGPSETPSRAHTPPRGGIPRRRCGGGGAVSRWDRVDGAAGPEAGFQADIGSKGGGFRL